MLTFFVEHEQIVNHEMLQILEQEGVFDVIERIDLEEASEFLMKF